MDTPILEVANVTKCYGKKKALDGLSFSLGQGKIMGLLGPNGSGKTTLLKLIAGLLRPNEGAILVCGNPIGTESKARVSYLHDTNPCFSWMRAIDAIDYYADFFPDFDRGRATEMLAFMELQPDMKVRQMSKGMVEKLNLTLTFSRQARLFLLDEPLGGIDPLARQRIVATIIKAFRPDAALLISTHLLNDLENMFNEVLFIREGKMLLAGNAEELRQQHGMSMEQLYLQLYGGTGENS